MTKTLLVLAHPDLSASRMNKALLDHVSDLENVTVNNLYSKYPEFKIDAKVEQQLLLEHDHVILQFPLFWYHCPPLMKKWFDDVLSYGFAYGENGDKLKNKKLYLAVTTGGPEGAYSREGYNHYTIDELLTPIKQTARLCQMTYVDTFLVQGAREISDVALKEKSGQYRDLLRNRLNHDGV